MTSEEKSEIRQMIRGEVEARLQIILNGLAQGSEKYTETIAAMFPGMDPLLNCPKVEPYGFHSRAPDGTPSVCAQIGSHPGSKYVVGHRDGKRPDVESGESTTYSVAGYEVRVGLTAITIRKGSVSYTAVVGEPLATILSAMLSDIASHTHSFTPSGVTPGLGSGTPGTTGAPGNAAAFTTLKSQVDAGAILAEDGGAF